MRNITECPAPYQLYMHQLNDNGKPIERWGRKAKGSKAEFFSQDSLLPNRDGT